MSVAGVPQRFRRLHNHKGYRLSSIAVYATNRDPGLSWKSLLEGWGPGVQRVLGLGLNCEVISCVSL